MTKVTNLAAFKEATSILEIERACGGSLTLLEIYDACLQLNAAASDERLHGQGENSFHSETSAKGQEVVLDLEAYEV